MSSRRVEKVARAIQGIISQVIQSQLSDPRIQGMISVTRVNPSPDLRSARVYLSILGVDETQQRLSLQGICHARGHIQYLLARQVALKSCPTLHFYLDDSLKKGFEMVQLIDKVAAEFKEPEASAPSEEPVLPQESNDERQQ